MNEDQEIRVEALAFALKRESDHVLEDAQSFYDFIANKDGNNA